MSERRLRFVEVVTREHGEVFADSWEVASVDSGSLTEASGETHIMKWPDDEVGQNHYHEIEHEIARRVYDELRDDIIDLTGANCLELCSLRRVSDEISSRRLS